LTSIHAQAVLRVLAGLHVTRQARHAQCNSIARVRTLAFVHCSVLMLINPNRTRPADCRYPLIKPFDRRRARRNILRQAGRFAPRRCAIRLRCRPARSRIHAFGRRRRVRRASLNRLSGSRAWPPSPPLLRPCSNLRRQCTSKPKCTAQTHRSACRYAIRAPRARIVTRTNETSNYNPNALTHSRSVLTCNSTTLANGSW
jgi:hypothetical protein